MRQSHGTAPKSTGMPEAQGRMQCNLWLKWKTFFNPPTAWFPWQTQKSRLWLPFSCPEDQPAYSAPFGSPDSLLPNLHCFPVGCLGLAGFQYGPTSLSTLPQPNCSTVCPAWIQTTGSPSPLTLSRGDFLYYCNGEMSLRWAASNRV